MKELFGTRFSRFEGYTFTMSEWMILAVVLTAIAALVGFGYGIHALRLMRDQSNRKALRLAALNLLEPSVTIGTLLVIFVATDASNSSEAAQLLPLMAGFPLTVMLLAPLFATREPLQRVVLVYGLLRWANTVALWVIGLTSSAQQGSDETRILLAVALIFLGLLMLIASVLHIGSSLGDAATTQSA